LTLVKLRAHGVPTRGAETAAESLALGNHCEAVRSQIAKVTEETREPQLHALREAVGVDGVDLGRRSPEVLSFLVTGIPRRYEWKGVLASLQRMMR
jgi:hypothetical protein